MSCGSVRFRIHEAYTIVAESQGELSRDLGPKRSVFVVWGRWEKTDPKGVEDDGS